MDYVRLGRTGLKVSRLCLGTMPFGQQCDAATSLSILDAAAEGGITFLDTANVYPMGGSLETVGRTEEILGQWLKGRRERFILATKCSGRMGLAPWQMGTSRKHVLWAIDASLKRLGTDYVDLYQVHHDDFRTPLDETLEALDTVVRSGRARYVGCSNYLAYRLARALGRSEVLGTARFVSAQPRYNMLFRQPERELLPLCLEENIAVLPYNPLAGGMLAGKYRADQVPQDGSRFAIPSTSRMYQERYWHEPEFAAVQMLREVAGACGAEMITVALAWVLSNPAITSPIIGASRPEQLQAALAAANFSLGPEAKAQLDQVTHVFRMGDASR